MWSWARSLGTLTCLSSARCQGCNPREGGGLLVTRATPASLQTVLLWQNTTGWLAWLAYKKQKFISHSLGCWKSKIRVAAWSGEDFSLFPHTVERASFYKGMNLIQEGSTLWPNHLPKVVTLTPSQWASRFQYNGFWRDTHIQTIEDNN